MAARREGHSNELGKQADKKKKTSEITMSDDNHECHTFYNNTLDDDITLAFRTELTGRYTAYG